MHFLLCFLLHINIFDYICSTLNLNNITLSLQHELKTDCRCCGTCCGADLIVCPAACDGRRHGQNGAPIQKTMYGIFFEDINYGADGGLYGEMLVNRSFEFKQSLTGWTTFGNVNVKDDGPFERCPHYVELAWPGHADRLTGMQNSGYGGISLKQGEDYRLTLWAKAAGGEGGIKVELIDQLTDSEPQAFVTQELKITSGEWKNMN